MATINNNDAFINLLGSFFIWLFYICYTWCNEFHDGVRVCVWVGGGFKSLFQARFEDA